MSEDEYYITRYDVARVPQAVINLIHGLIKQVIDKHPETVITTNYTNVMHMSGAPMPDEIVVYTITGEEINVKLIMSLLAMFNYFSE